MLIRKAVPEDAMAVARVHVASWQAAYRGLLPDEYLAQLQPEQRAPHYDFANDDPQKPQTLVAVDENVIVGFATTMPSRDADLPDHGELCALYVAPEHWGCGFGVALAVAAGTRLAEAGFQHALLWVLDGNERAQRFYRRDGWLSDGSRRTDTIWGVTVNEARWIRKLHIP